VVGGLDSYPGSGPECLAGDGRLATQGEKNQKPREERFLNNNLKKKTQKKKKKKKKEKKEEEEDEE
jgi:hypothetical protein